MIFAYMDEAGSTGKRLTAEGQPFHYVGALLVPSEKWLAVRNDLNEIKDDLPKEVRNHPKFEFHAAELFNGTGSWSRMTNPKERLAIYEVCINILAEHKIEIVYGRANKQLLQRYIRPMHPHCIALWLCIERIAGYLNIRGQTQANIVGSIVADKANPEFCRIDGETLDQLRTKGPPFGVKINVTRIIDIIHYMDSKQSPHLQLCDLALYAIRRRDVAREPLSNINDKIDPLVWDYGYFPY